MNRFREKYNLYKQRISVLDEISIGFNELVRPTILCIIIQSVARNCKIIVVLKPIYVPTSFTAKP